MAKKNGIVTWVKIGGIAIGLLATLMTEWSNEKDIQDAAREAAKEEVAKALNNK